MSLQTFHIAGLNGPEPAQGAPYVATIGGRQARLFIHTECPIEGARLSCQRSGLTLGKIAPLLLVRIVTRELDASTPAQELERIGAGLLVDSLVAKHGPDRLWQVMDRAPAIEPVPA